MDLSGPGHTARWAYWQEPDGFCNHTKKGRAQWPGPAKAIYFPAVQVLAILIPVLKLILS